MIQTRTRYLNDELKKDVPVNAESRLGIGLSVTHAHVKFEFRNITNCHNLLVKKVNVWSAFTQLCFVIHKFLNHITLSQV